MSFRLVAALLAILLPAGPVLAPVALTLGVLLAAPEAAHAGKKKRNLNSNRANKITADATKTPGADLQKVNELGRTWQKLISDVRAEEEELAADFHMLSVREDFFKRAQNKWAAINLYINKQRDKMSKTETTEDHDHYRIKIEKLTLEQLNPATTERDRTLQQVRDTVASINEHKQMLNNIHRQIGSIRDALWDFDDFEEVTQDPLDHPLAQAAIATHSQYGRIGVIYETLPRPDLIYVDLPPESASSSTSSSATAASSSTSTTAQPFGATNSTSWGTPTGQPPAGLIFPGSK